MDHQNLQEWALRAQRGAILERLEIVQPILPAYDDLSCCCGLLQRIVSALKDRLSHPAGRAVEGAEVIQVMVAS